MLHIGDAREWATTLAPGSVQCLVTSPPYWKLRSYLASDHPDKAREFGNEATPEEFVENLVGLFRLLRPALHESGTCWVNLGDSYAGNAGGQQGPPGDRATRTFTGTMNGGRGGNGLKDKDLVGIPWLVAFALRADGWYLRSEIIWQKPSPMPESVTDRPTRAHEQIFLFSKRPTYFYDAEAIKEPASPNTAIKLPYGRRRASEWKEAANGSGVKNNPSFNDAKTEVVSHRNKRSVWTVSSAQFPGSHFATFPPELIRPCILAGTSAKGACVACGAPWKRVVAREKGYSHDVPKLSELAKTGVSTNGTNGSTLSISGGSKGWAEVGSSSQTVGWQPSCTCNAGVVPCTVLDPFMGSGTVAQVAVEEGRAWVGCDLDARAREWTRARLDGRQIRLAV